MNFTSKCLPSLYWLINVLTTYKIKSFYMPIYTHWLRVRTEVLCDDGDDEERDQRRNAPGTLRHSASSHLWSTSNRCAIINSKLFLRTPLTGGNSKLRMFFYVIPNFISKRLFLHGSRLPLISKNSVGEQRPKKENDRFFYTNYFVIHIKQYTTQT